MVHTHESQQPCRSRFHPVQEGGEGESIQGDGDGSHAGHYQVSSAVAKSSVSKWNCNKQFYTLWQRSWCYISSDRFSGWFCFSLESKKKANIQGKAVFMTGQRTACPSYKWHLQNIVILKCRINDAAWKLVTRERVYVKGRTQWIFLLYKRKSVIFKVGKNCIFGILFINMPVIEITELNVVAWGRLDRKTEWAAAGDRFVS